MIANIILISLIVLVWIGMLWKILDFSVPDMRMSINNRKIRKIINKGLIFRQKGADCEFIVTHYKDKFAVYELYDFSGVLMLTHLYEGKEYSKVNRIKQNFIAKEVAKKI